MSRRREELRLIKEKKAKRTNAATEEKCTEDLPTTFANLDSIEELQENLPACLADKEGVARDLGGKVYKTSVVASAANHPPKLVEPFDPMSLLAVLTSSTGSITSAAGKKILTNNDDSRLQQAATNSLSLEVDGDYTIGTNSIWDNLSSDGEDVQESSLSSDDSSKYYTTDGSVDDSALIKFPWEDESLEGDSTTERNRDFGEIETSESGDDSITEGEEEDTKSTNTFFQDKEFSKFMEAPISMALVGYYTSSSDDKAVVLTD